MKPMRVATWNLFGRRPERVGLDLLVATHRPAIMMLQEADGDAISADEDLSRALPHRVIDAGAGARPGMAVLSSYDILASGRLDAPRRAFDRPRVLWADLRLPDGSALRAVCVHATAPDSLLPPPYNPIRRNRQLRAITAFARRELASGRLLLIGGDFNTVRYRIAGMTDVAEVGGRARPTWRGLPVGWIPPLLRLDRILVGPGLAVEEARVGREFHGSDHCPVMARIRLV